jgi:hypothetical protein
MKGDRPVMSDAKTFIQTALGKRSLARLDDFRHQQVVRPSRAAAIAALTELALDTLAAQQQAQTSAPTAQVR